MNRGPSLRTQGVFRTRVTSLQVARELTQRWTVTAKAGTWNRSHPWLGHRQPAWSSTPAWRDEWVEPVETESRMPGTRKCTAQPYVKSRWMGLPMWPCCWSSLTPGSRALGLRHPPSPARRKHGGRSQGFGVRLPGSVSWPWTDWVT